MNSKDLSVRGGGRDPLARGDDTQGALPGVQKPLPVPAHGRLEVLASLSRDTERNPVPTLAAADYHATPERLLASARRLAGGHFDDEALVEALRKSDDPQVRFQAFRNFVMERLPVLPTGAMKTIGHGGEHTVYAAADRSPRDVVKINRFSISRSVQWGLLFGRNADTGMPKNLWDEAWAVARSEDEKYREMAGFFPEGSVPSQTTRVELIALRGETLDLLRHMEVPPDPRRGWPELDYSTIYHVPTIIRVQRFVAAAAEPDHPSFSLSMRFLERLDSGDSSRLSRLYAAANDSWVLNRTADFDPEAFEYVVQGTQLERLYNLSESDRQLRDGLRDFVSRLIEYNDDKRMMTDFGGDGNVVFKGASYHLIDAFFGMQNVFDDAERALRKIGTGDAISLLEKRNAFFLINYVRATNAVAHALGIKKRIELFRPEQERPALDWAQVRAALQTSVQSGIQESSRRKNTAVFFPVPISPI